MGKLEAFLARGRERARMKAVGRQIKKYLERCEKRSEEETQDAGMGVKRRRRGAG